jgi:hypothetical protein
MPAAIKMVLGQCGITVSVFFVMVLTSFTAFAQREIPVFRYTGSPGGKAPQGEAAGPGGAPKLIIPPRAITSDRSREASILDSYGARGWEQPGKWTSTINMTNLVGCTGTLIGPQVLLTAAHCVQRWLTIDLEVKWVPQRLIRTTCEIHPMYRPQGHFRQFDYGLCYLTEPFPVSVVVEDSDIKPYPVRFQRLSLDARDVSPRTRLLLAGFGCSSRTSERRDGNLRAGFAVVSFASSLRLTVGTPFGRESSLLCRGDSGGAAYRYLSADPYGPRVIVGVNSAHDLSRNASFVARTSDPAFVRFLQSWRGRRGNPKICGLDKAIDDQCHR